MVAPHSVLYLQTAAWAVRSLGAGRSRAKSLGARRSARITPPGAVRAVRTLGARRSRAKSLGARCSARITPQAAALAVRTLGAG